MEWFQLYVNDLSNRLLSAASSSAFGAWVRMLANCYRLENGGCYEHCSEHSSRQWMSIAQVDRAEVDEVVNAGLAAWEKGDLRVHGYDSAQQQRATERKEKGRDMALARWGHSASNAASNAKERKGKEIKKEERKDPPSGGSGGAEPAPSLSKSPRSRRKRRLDVLYTETFERFWAAYPRKAAKQKAACAWASGRLDQDLDRILTALEWQRKTAQWAKDGGDKIPYPASYLNGRRWEDEPSAYPKTGNGGRPTHDIRIGRVGAEQCVHSDETGEVAL